MEEFFEIEVVLTVLMAKLQERQWELFGGLEAGLVCQKYLSLKQGYLIPCIVELISDFSDGKEPNKSIKSDYCKKLPIVWQSRLLFSLVILQRRYRTSSPRHCSSVPWH